MFKNLFQKEEKAFVNRRKFVRANLELHVCAALIREHDEAFEQVTYSRCFSTTTKNISAGGACIVHKNLLVTGDKLKFINRYGALTDKCLSCKDLPALDETLMIEPVFAEVKWRTNISAGIEFVKIREEDREAIHRLMWEQHVKEVRVMKEWERRRT